MNHSSYILLLSIFLIGKPMAANFESTQKLSTPSATYILKKNEFNNLKKQAENGSSDAAIQLAKYYALGARDIPFKERKEKELFWWKNAAEKGNIIAIKSVITLSIDRCDLENAKFWVEKLPKNDTDKIYYQKKIKEKECSSTK